MEKARAIDRGKILNLFCAIERKSSAKNQIEIEIATVPWTNSKMYMCTLSVSGVCMFEHYGML